MPIPGRTGAIVRGRTEVDTGEREWRRNRIAGVLFDGGTPGYAADLRKAAPGDALLVAFDRVFTRVFIDGSWR